MRKGTAVFTGLTAVQASDLAQPVQATPDAGRRGDAGQRVAVARAWLMASAGAVLRSHQVARLI
jgi:hypothetical protein